MKEEKGIHIIVDLYGCNEKKIDNVKFMNSLVNKALSKSNLVSYGTLYHKFNPKGFTSITLLAASHLSIHTWPELKYVSLDIFACDEREKAIKASNIIIDELNPNKIKKRILYRGFVYKQSTKQ